MTAGRDRYAIAPARSVLLISHSVVQELGDHVSSPLTYVVHKLMMGKFTMDQHTISTNISRNRRRLVGQKAPFKLHEIWAIRFRLQMASKIRDLALFNLAIDSKLRGCDLVNLRVRDISSSDGVMDRAMIIQQKTGRPVQFEITSQSRGAVGTWIASARLRTESYLFPTRSNGSSHLSTRQYARLVKGWSRGIGLDPTNYGTHSLRRTKATLIYRNTKNLRAVQLLLGHSKLESTVRYLGVDVEDALTISEQTEI